MVGQINGLSHGCVQTSIASIWDDFTIAVFDSYVPSSPKEYKSARSPIDYPAAVGALDATSFQLTSHLKERKTRSILVVGTESMG